MVKDRSISSVVLDIVIHLTLIFLVVVTLYPIIYIFSVSLSSAAAYESGKVVLFPVEFTWDAYEIVFTAGTVPKAFLNSVVYTLLYTVLTLAFTTTMAYPLSRSSAKLAFKGFYNRLVVFTMFFNAGTIPIFLVVQNLGLLNTMWSLILPGLITTYNLVVMRTFFVSIPVELEEAAFLDGANEFTIFYKIVLPLSKAAIATVGLFYAVHMWNSWYNAMLYIEDAEKFPLQLVLRDIIVKNQMAAELAAQGDMSLMAEVESNVESIKYATLFISIAPMLAVYPFIQKYFVKGVMVGSVKG